MYFQEFPTIIYDSVGDGNFKDVKNLLRRVGLRVAVRTNILLYDTYDVKEGETPEIIASKLYDDPELHWVILMINNVTDRFHQWPMSTPQFNAFVNEKYVDSDGEPNPSGVHHYEITQTSGDTTKKIEVTDLTNYPSASTVTNYEYEERRQDELRQIRLLDPEYVDILVEQYRSLMNESSI